ncbi:putative peptidase [Halobacteriovorax marinus SJ]|uniref:Peptidase n=1 Tax=Halobacteriovorax marinus (strain ATCC BAA-682 / DSM 15412 / SJ) TaxID=862908 RepID=E1X1T2_HALMS|nr:S8 family serine peptidase [Halobacteriovorax marinus]CBW26592.1 putative peptidase [Halobacteriovorax marinus SJ]
MKKMALGLGLLFSASTLASTVAIIDSGTDMKHKDIAPKAWINSVEIPDNNRDEDRNGYQDDIYGWNFAESNNQVIDYKYLGTLNEDVRKFFIVQEKMMRQTATQEEIEWAREILKDEAFIKRISIYGNFMHGTHVAGIAAKKANNAKIMAVKLIPTEVKLPGQDKISKKDGFALKMFKKGLELLAKQQATMMEEIGYYVDGHKADVANGSFGTGYPQAQQITAMLYKTLFRKDPTPELNHELSLVFLNAAVRENARLVEVAPNTLFVFAAGNDGLDNDKFPTSPTNIQADNVISVAATMGRMAIAPFSNYGKEMVDVAAPGVGILSAAPGDEYVKVSGTSQAAPFVANIAARVKDANPSLSPVDIKKIIMGTVDYKNYLTDKVLTGGLVNPGRAVQAGILSGTRSVEDSISAAREQVADVVVEGEAKSLPLMGSGFVIPLPSMFKF